MADLPLPNGPDPLKAAEEALRQFGAGPKKNRAERRWRRGVEPGSGKHPSGATKAYPSERAAARRKRRRSR